jgi:peptidoglycan/xylan/chitin deacetylase (PgdA/CDA1 family)
MIYISHGVVPCWSNNRISHALFLPESRVERHLQVRRTKYAPLAQALNGDGDALTIDDATYGGLKLALLARQYGHAVSWFVNGSNVEHGTQYYPFQLSSMLDRTRLSECQFADRSWELQTMAGRRALRLRIKQAYMRLRSQNEIEQLIQSLACSLRLDAAAMENSLATVGPAELAQAVVAGVDLQNHGWSHLNPQVSSERKRTAEVRQNEEYLSQFRKAITCVYAPPFGQQVSLASVPAQFVLLADRNLVSGHLEGNLVNRGDLRMNDFTGSIPDQASYGRNGRIAA